jgi:hypothetical protein
VSKGIAEVIAGSALIAVDVAFLGANPALIMVGAGLVIGGIGTILNKKLTGMAADTMNPIAPRNVIYGRGETGGTTIFLLDTGETNKYLHMVRILAAHPCEALDAVRFDNKRLPLDADGNSISFQDATAVIGSQQTVSIASMVRTSGTVTVVMSGAMPLPAVGVQGGALIDGDQVLIKDVTTDATLNGTYQIQIIDSTSFIYVNGGTDISIGAEGSVETTWPDYGDTVHMEVALGTQTIADPPFPGLLAVGDTGSNGLWTDHHTLTNCTAVYLRLKYGGNTYASGLPTIRFQIRGKNDISDPRSSPATIAYTENAALCIADYLTNVPFGFRAAYGTEVPLDPLIAAANICDEDVPLASGGTEPRYALNGGFVVSVKRGEVLQNMLTACGGRLTYSGGQFIIHPASWPGTPTGIGGDTTATLNILTSHVPGTPTAASAMCSIDGFSLFSRGWLGFNGDPSAWTLRTDSTTVPSNAVGGLRVMFAIGTASPITLDTPDDFLVYDCYLDVVYPDGTTATLRPRSAAIDFTWTDGTITDPGNAIDGDPSTAATIERTHLNTLDFSPVLVLSDFIGPNTPNLTPAGIISSKAATSLMAGPFQWKEVLSARDLYNGVKGTYVCPANNWQASDIPPYAQDIKHGYMSGSPMFPEGDANMAADSGDRRWKDIQLPFTISSATAQRLCKVELMRTRQQGTGTFVFNLAMYKFTALDIVSVTLPFMGWYGKLFEISAHRFTVNKQQNGENEAMLLGTELDLQETSASVYDWSTTEELSGQGGQQTVFPNSAVRTVAPPTSVAAVSGSSVAAVGSDGVAVSRIQVTWTTPADGFVTEGGHIEVQYHLASSPLGAWTAVGQFDPSADVAYIDGVTDGTDYTVRIRSVNTAGAASDWVTTDVTASGSSLRRIDDEIPGGTIDGSNVTFTLSEVPSPAASLQLFRNGTLMIQGLDYTLGSPVTHTITTTTAPLTNDSLRAWYWY